MKKIIILLLTGFIYQSCSKLNSAKDTIENACGKLILTGHAFSGEKRILFVNDKKVYDRSFNQNQRSFTTRDKICAEFLGKTKIRLISTFHNKRYIDTTFIFNANKKEDYYQIAISLPHPLNLDEYIKNGKIIKSWGYIPIDSSKRFIGLYPASHDTIDYR